MKPDDRRKAQHKSYRLHLFWALLLQRRRSWVAYQRFSLDVRDETLACMSFYTLRISQANDAMLRSRNRLLKWNRWVNRIENKQPVFGNRK